MNLALVRRPSFLSSNDSLIAVLGALALAACSPRPALPDAADAPWSDASDTPLGDTAPDAFLPDPTMCLGRPTEDLAALGTREGRTLRYASNNSTAPADLDQAVQPPGSCRFRVVHQRVFRYTTHATAALRVSTNNPGSDASFDSVLMVLHPPCDAEPLGLLACNDDDPLAPPQPHVTLSLVTTPVLPAGTTVLIAVGGFYPAFGSGQKPNPAGEVGAFELSVEEIEPIALGAECDPSGRRNICPADSSCVPETLAGVTYRCLANGSAPGAACLSDQTCTGSLRCDAQNNTCYELVPTGAGCDRVGVARQRCTEGATCLSPVRGSARGVCTPHGSAPQTPCASGLRCTGTGLVCRPNSMTEGTCLRAAPAGGPCNSTDSLCPAGQSCVAIAPGALIGTCTPEGSVPGAACRAAAPECDAPLFCIASGGERSCRTIGLAPGDACGPRGACSFDDECIAFEPSEPYHGVCVRPGTRGGACRAEGAACDSGLSCTNTANRAFGRCVLDVPSGGTCELGGRGTRCASGTSCVREASGGTTGVCRANGTVAGSACRSSGTRCDGALECSTSAGAGICQAASVDGACEPRFASLRCPAGQVCRAIGLEIGTCAVPLDETEPNDAPSALASPLALPLALRGALVRYDVDCVLVEVPEGASLFASAVAPDGRCDANLALDVYRAEGTIPLGTDADSGPYGCPLVDGSDPDFPWAQALPAGRYAVCIREAGDRRAVPAYVLSLALR